MNKLFFIIGLRRSGTSILRQLVMRNPGISGIEFEPHELWAAVDLNHFDRIKKKENVKRFIQTTFRFFINLGERGKPYGWHGAKFALNPGVKALEWVWLDKTFPGCKFIFIQRNLKSTYNSYYNQDKQSVRGVIDSQAYFILAKKLIIDFGNYVRSNPGRACLVDYETMLNNPDAELSKVWKLLNIQPITGLKKLIRKPQF
jgi:hypothetical protein